jgi:glutathione S-transferase
MALIDSVLETTGWLVAETPSLADFYLAACLRWAQLYPSGKPLIAREDVQPRLQGLLGSLESRYAVVKAFADEHIAGHPLTRPGPPGLPPGEVIG